MPTLRKIALGLVGVEEGIACKSTSLECAIFKTGSKAFLFVGAKDARLKLQESLAEAAQLAKKQPNRYHVGASGWVKITVSKSDPLPLDLLARWIEESYRLMAPKPKRSVTAAVTKKGQAKKKPKKSMTRKMA